MKKKSPRRALASLRAHLHSRAANHTGTPAQSRTSEHTGTPVRNRAWVRAAALLLAAVLLAVPTAPSLAKFVASRTVATISLNVAEKPAGNMLIRGDFLNNGIKGKGSTWYDTDTTAKVDNTVLSVTFGRLVDYSDAIESVKDTYENVDENRTGEIKLYRVEDSSSTETDKYYNVYILLDDPTNTYSGIIANKSCENMFSDLRAVTKIVGLEMLDTSRVTNMRMMFNHLEKITSLDLSSFDTSNVTDMSTMFAYDKKLQSLDLSTFDTSIVTLMNNMFHYCESLTELDISMFDTHKVINMKEMFKQCKALKTIYVHPTLWNTDSVTESKNSKDMFASCSSLIGGNGTTFNSSYTDIAYARIDTEGNPGYLTDIADKPTGSEPVETTTEPTTEATTSPTTEPTSNPTTEATTPATGESTTAATADPSTPPASETLPLAEG